MARKSKGRQKIPMEKMKHESNLQVTFSKRRSGLFKKASELCTLCGAEVAIIVFSPGRKVFSFGHPCVESIIERFLCRNIHPSPQQSSATMQLIEAHRNATVRDLNTQLTQVLSELEVEKKKGEELTQIRKANKKAENWWESPIEELNLAQLDQLKGALEDLRKTVSKQAEKILQTMPPQHFYVGSSSSSGGRGLNFFDHKRTTGFHPSIQISSSYGYNQGFKSGYNLNYKPNYNSGFKQEYSSGYEPDYNPGYRPEYNPDYNPTFGSSYN